MKQTTKDFLAYSIVIIGIILGLYVGGWIMFIKPIMSCCYAFDAGVLTVADVGVAAIKCVFASFVGYIIFLIATITATFIRD